MARLLPGKVGAAATAPSIQRRSSGMSSSTSHDRLSIGGEWVPPHHGGLREHRRGDRLGPGGRRADGDRAVGAARRALPGWSATRPAQRAQAARLRRRRREAGGRLQQGRLRAERRGRAEIEELLGSVFVVFRTTRFPENGTAQCSVTPGLLLGWTDCHCAPVVPEGVPPRRDRLRPPGRPVDRRCRGFGNAGSCLSR
jgi:hypothetical protein